MIEVHVWRCHLDVDAATLDTLAATLSADELRRASWYQAPIRRCRAIAASAMLRAVLEGYAEAPASSLRFDRGSHGKPRLVAGNRRDDVRFSASRSGDLAVVAVTRRREVGIDLEEIMPARAHGPIADRLFTPDESTELWALPAEAGVVRFFELWTRKEAHAKALGTGLSVPLERLGAIPDGWLLADVSVGEGFACAVCVQARRARVRVFEHELAVPRSAVAAS